MDHAIYTGAIAHRRYIPKSHAFSYPFFMYYLNLNALEELPEMGRWFSTKKLALSRFHRRDYYGKATETLSDSIKTRMAEITGKQVEGDVCGLINVRTLGLYFSPVNFYYGFDRDERFTHFLAEVSNIPWNERYQYAHYVGDGEFSPANGKEFKVSPFNPVNQYYKWNVSPPRDEIRVQLEVSDERGRIFNAALQLQHHPLTLDTLKKQLLRKPVMTVSIVAAIYYQALKIYLKGIPYIPYQKEII